MPTELLVGLLVGLVLSGAAIATAIRAPTLGIPIRMLALIPFVLFGLFSMYGFAAAFEPGDYHIVWRILYGVVFLACLAAIVRVVFTKPRTRATEPPDREKG